MSLDDKDKVRQYLIRNGWLQADGSPPPEAQEMIRPVTAEDIACPECGGLLDRNSFQLISITVYEPPYCPDPECGWDSPRFQLPPWSTQYDERDTWWRQEDSSA